MQPNRNGQSEQAIQRVEVAREMERPTADVDVLAIIERRNAMLERILRYAISATHAGQWVDQGGKPYPTAPAAEVMARRCAVRIENVHTEKMPSSDDKGPFYLYVATCTASLPGGFDSLQAMGTCSSRDTFLGTETKAGRLMSEIDEGNILKAAYSNMLVNAITRLLGVRNLTWEQLASYGINQGQVAKVDYHQGSKGGGGVADAAQPTVKFGKDKGKTPSELDDSNLAWHIRAAAESVAKNDPKWHNKNVEWLKVLEAEKERRSKPAEVATEKKPDAPAIADRKAKLGEKAKKAGMTRETFNAWAAQLLQSNKPSTEWTLMELSAVEEALDAEIAKEVA